MVKTIFVHERESYWTAELTRCLATAMVHWEPDFPRLLTNLQVPSSRLDQNNLLADLQVQSRTNPPEAVAVLLVGEGAVRKVARLRCASPDCHIVVVTPSLPPDSEWVARELGADLVLSSRSGRPHVVAAIEKL